MLELLGSNGLLIVFGGSIVIALAIVVLLLKSKKQMQQITDNQRQVIRGMEKEVAKANNQLLEIRSVVVGLGQKVSEQQDVIQHLSERVTELEHVDTDSRMYSRANKMVQLGAGINELIEECELPKAEAELMMALQKKISGEEKIPPMSGEKIENKPPRPKIVRK